MKTRKTLKKIICAAVCAAAVFSVKVASTEAAPITVGGTGTVIQPLVVTKDTDLAFGKFAAGTGGTVVIDNDGGRTKTGDVMLASGGTVSAAHFSLTGEAAAAYAVTIPAGSITLTDGASHNITVDTFTSTGAGTLTGGAGEVGVGATATIASGQAPGNYTGNFPVTIEYN